MERGRTRGRSLLLALVLLLGLAAPAWAEGADPTLTAAVEDTAVCVLSTVKSPQVGSVGGEWAVLGLARSGYEVPENYYRDYYAAVETYVRDHRGVLHERKYTEYSRVIVALSAIGRDARNVAGYDLTVPLGDYERTIWQGLNGPIWALIALDSRDYPMPENPEAATQATRQMYIDRILSCQLADGGWSLLGGTEEAGAKDGVSDPDITGMALQALAKYQDQPAVAQATREALDCISRQQDQTGACSSWGARNSESCVQVICALCELGIPLDDSRFVKNGKTLLDGLMTFYRPGKGFLHTEDSGVNQMATEQGLYGLTAILRVQQGKPSLYRMGDAAGLSAGEGPQPGTGLPGRHADVVPVPLTRPGTTFGDIAGHANQAAMAALAAREIINGKGSGRFCPDDSMTRAEFAAIVVRALGLTPALRGTFTDVPAGQWYAPYVDTAAAYGVITGVGNGRFSPNGTITRQEAAVMVARAAALCGMDTEMNASAVRDVLAQFADYTRTPDWARQGLAFCYGQGILDDSALEIGGTETIRRCEIAQMLFTLLDKANLL